ncbi:MAG: hypothetical protein LBG44_01995 [Gemmatimonadota bacterium]|nr:hypothetical protein [Gemmatimonadota bacterium]
MIALSREYLFLAEMRSLIETRQYWELEKRLGSLDESCLLENRELGYCLAAAWLNLHRSRKGLELTRKLLQVYPGANDVLSHRIELLYASFLSRESRLQEALVAAMRCVGSSTALEIPKFGALSNNCLGIIYCMQGEGDLAITQLMRTVISYRNIGDKRGVAMSSFNLGMAYGFVGLYEQSDRFFSSAAMYYLTDGIVEENIAVEGGRSLAISGIGDDKRAIKMAQRALEKCRRLDNAELTGELIRVLATVYRNSRRFPEARRLFIEAYRHARKYKQASLVAEIHLEYGKLQNMQNEPELAKHHFKAAHKYYETIGATGWCRMIQAEEQRCNNNRQITERPVFS